MPDDITLGEVNRNVTKLDVKIDSLTDMLSKYATQSMVETTIMNARNISQQQIDELRGDIAEINSWRTWFQRIIGGAVILAMVGFIVGGGLVQ